MNSLDLKQWPIFTVLQPEFTSQIHMIMNFKTTEKDGDAALIVTRDKTVYGLGINYEGRLGIGKINRTLYPKKVETLCEKDIKTFVYGNGNRVFALTEEGKVYSWGFNRHYLLGHASDTSDIVYIPTLIHALETERIVNVTCSDDHSLALTADGKVYIWGVHVCQPTQVFDKIVSIACGSTFNVVVNHEGKMNYWDNVQNIQLYSTSHLLLPYHASLVYKQISLPQETIKVACGCKHILALTKEGELHIQGNNNFGQLGIGNNIDFTSGFTRLNVPKMGKISDIAAMPDKNISVAIGEDGCIYIWGYCFGQIIVTPIATQFSSIQDVFIYNVPYIMDKKLIGPADNCKYSNGGSNINKYLETAFNDSSTSDLTIQVKDQLIHVHKIVLQRSQYYRNMFQHNWAENNDNVIKHDQFSYVVYKAFLKYLYTDVIDLPPKKILELTKLADAYCETNLKRDCVQILKKLVNKLKISESNAALLYSKAVKYNAKELEEVCFEFMLNHLTAVIQTENFIQLDDNTKTTFIIKAAKKGLFKT